MLGTLTAQVRVILAPGGPADAEGLVTVPEDHSL